VVPYGRQSQANGLELEEGADLTGYTPRWPQYNSAAWCRR